MKIIVAAVVLAAAVSVLLLSGCGEAPLEPEAVAGDATAPAPCTFEPAPTTPSKIVPPTTWGATAPGAEKTSWRYEFCFDTPADKTHAICQYYEGQYDLSVVGCSPAPGVTCVAGCP